MHEEPLDYEILYCCSCITRVFFSSFISIDFLLRSLFTLFHTQVLGIEPNKSPINLNITTMNMSISADQPATLWAQRKKGKGKMPSSSIIRCLSNDKLVCCHCWLDCVQITLEVMNALCPPHSIRSDAAHSFDEMSNRLCYYGPCSFFHSMPAGVSLVVLSLWSMLIHTLRQYTAFSIERQAHGPHVQTK